MTFFKGSCFMFNSINTKVVLFIVATAFMLVACDKPADESDKATVLSSDDTILQYVPADTPYVFANVAPLPDDLMDKLEPKIDRLLQSYQTILREVIAAKQQELSEEERNSEKIQEVNAFVGEFMTLLSIEGMREAGIGRDATGALYGNGLLPVVRFELSDGALFNDAILRLEEKAGNELPVAEVDGHSYRYFDADKVRIVIAVMDNQVVFTIVPANFDAAQTGRALGLTLPETNIAETGVLQEIADEYGFTDHYVGFFDVRSITDRFVSQAKGLDADLLALMDYDASDLSDVCREEIRSVAGIAPRMVLGYTAISTDQLDSTVVVELREDIAAGLQALSGAVPGLGGDPGGLMSFGMSIDVKAARAFVEARLDAMEAQPFECEHLADLQAGVAGGREALNKPVPPMVYDFKGFLAVVDDIEGLDIATQTPPTSVDGSFLLAMENATALVSMGALFSPEIAALNLQTDGQPVPLEMPQLQTMGIAAHAALTENGLAISIGEDSESQVESMLGAEASDPAPFVSFSMDAARYYGFLGEAIAAGRQDQDKGASPEMQAAMKDIMQAIADIYDRMYADVRFTTRGLEIESSVTLKD
jgi:hypothetical protein